MVYCVAYNCTNGSGSGKSVFNFPKNAERRKQWTQRVNIHNFHPDKHHSPVLCEDHFTRDCFSKNPEICKQLGIKLFLKDDAVPTIFYKKIPGKRTSEQNDSRNGPVRKRTKSCALTQRHSLEVKV